MNLLFNIVKLFLKFQSENKIQLNDNRFHLTFMKLVNILEKINFINKIKFVCCLNIDLD